MIDDPAEFARTLAAIYGFDVVQPVTYPLGVTLSAKLRLAASDDNLPIVAGEIAELARALVDAPLSIPDAAPCLATACFADELFASTGNPAHRQLLITSADRFHADPDVRVEDFFFAGALLGRAATLIGDARYADSLFNLLLAADTLTDDDLYWHCHGSPWYWGRGNAFAALGIAEALSAVRDHPQRPELIARNECHLLAVRKLQATSGMWHQVIDDPSTFEEYSATCMFGYAIARGIHGGWLSADWLGVVESAWRGIVSQTSVTGELNQVCVGTGPLDSRNAYVTRAYSTGLDDRGGAMALWFATAMAALV
jgi:rhamnogalacturonyl hydrolase YesR